VHLPEQKTAVIVGQQLTLEAPERMIYDQKVGKFTYWIVTNSWSVELASGDTVTVPDRRHVFFASTEAMTYVAFYEYVAPATLNFLPSVTQEVMTR
jgi:hypothetical protein